MSNPDPSQQKLLDAIVGRAAYDAAFRRRLLATPREAIHSAFGVEIPETFRVRFIEKEADVDLLVVLPDLKPAGDELTDADLDAVAGGTVTNYRWHE